MLSPGTRVYAAASLNGTGPTGPRILVRWGDDGTVVNAGAAEGQYVIDWHSSAASGGAAAVRTQAPRQMLSLEPLATREGQWVQFAREIHMRSGKVVQRRSLAIVLDERLPDEDGTGGGQLLVRVAPVGTQDRFDISVSPSDVEPAQLCAVVGCYSPAGAVQGFQATDTVYALKPITNGVDEEVKVGPGDVGMVISAGQPKPDMLFVRFEATRGGGEPMWCTLPPEYVAKEPPALRGRRIRFARPLSFPDGNLIEADTMATVVSDLEEDGRLVVRVLQGEDQVAFEPPAGTFSVTHDQKTRTQHEFDFRVAELEALAKQNEVAGKQLLNVPLVNQNIWGICGFGNGVGLADFERDRAGIVSGQLRCRVLRNRKRDGLDGTLNGEKAFAFDHGALVGDQTRVGPYASAIKRMASGRRVLDIGTGPFCLLARLCLRAGATDAEAIEANSKSVELAAARFRGELEVPAWMALQGATVVADAPSSATSNGHDGGAEPSLRVRLGGDASRELRLFQGMSTDVSLGLSGGYGLLVHEILGDFAGTEGAAAVVADIHQRGLLAEGCACVPRRSSTLLAPTAKLEFDGMEALLHRMRHGGTLEVTPRVIYSARFFGRKELLAEPQPLEVLDFEACPELKQTRTLEFRTDRDGLFDGVHMHLHIDLGGDDNIDALALHSSSDPNDKCSWGTTYIRLLEEPISLVAGSRILVRCSADLSGALASYALDVSVGEAGQERVVSTIDWQGG